MIYEPIPITPALVSWSRIRAGISMSDAEAKFPDISEWENGESFPSYPQLEKLAKNFKVPIAVFFFPEPPDIPSITESFRTLPESELDSLPTKIRFLLRKAKAFQIGLEELTDGRNPSKRQIVKSHAIDKIKSIASFAKEIREELNLSIEEQISWRDEDFALKQFRNAFSEAGVFVFKDAFKTDEYSGFCLYDEEYPLIYINNTTAKTRQIFTLFHELAHLLFKTSGIDFLSDEFIDRLPNKSQKIEVVCNKFAAEFLFPDALFSSYLKKLPVSEETATALSKKYKVSREFIYRKYLDRELVTRNEYHQKAAKWRDQRMTGSKGSSGNYYNTLFTYLDRPYVEFAFTQYYREKINNIQLAEYLDIAPKNLGKVEGKFLGGAG